MKKIYEQALLACKAKAEELRCLLSPRYYEKYDWFVIYFCTDLFGGTACGAKYYGGKWYLDIFKKCVSYDTLEQVLQHVDEYVEHEFSVRDFDYISELVNSEYE